MRPLLLSLFDEAERRPLTVSELTSQVRGTLENRFASVWVEGEISIIRAVERRTRTVSLLLAPTRVQGEGAGREIARAIQSLNEHHLRALAEGRSEECVDVIIVGRGGGSSEDLWAFNEEEVARAIRASLVPVISAVGHETDFTIADFAADVRAATPTAAAEIVAEREDEIASYVERLTHTLVNAARYRIISERARAQEAAMSPGFDEVRMRLRVAREELDEARRGLERRVNELTARARRRLEAAARRLPPARMAASASRARV